MREKTKAVLTTTICGLVLFGLLAAPASAAEEPTFEYETLIDGFHLASGRGIAVDSAENAYVISRFVGDRDENNFIVTKLDAAGDEQWTKEVSAYDHDHAAGIAVDDEGGVYVTGWTDSDDFPIVNAEPKQGKFREVFVMKLAAEDGSTIFSRLLGGNYTDQAEAITVDASGNIWVVGSTISADFPVVDPLQEELNSYPYDSSDAFVTKLTNDGATILYSTFLGGSTDDVAKDIALDASGRIFLLGESLSDDFPLMNPLYEDEDPNRGRDLFVSRISPDGGTLEFSTYIGGENGELAGGLALDDLGDVYISAFTQSEDYPTTEGAYQETFVGEVLGCEIPFGGRFNCDDAVVTKIEADGSALSYSTFLGGTDVDKSRDITVDSWGRAHVIGYTNSPDFPPAGIDGSAAIFVSRLGTDGSSLSYSKIVVSGSANAGHGITIDDADDVYFTGAKNVPAETYIAKLTTGEDANHDPDAASDPDPADGASSVEMDPILSALVTDPDGNVMDVTFYDASTGQVIGTDFNVGDGERASVVWGGLSEDTPYEWYTMSNDGFSKTPSESWTFTTEGSSPSPPPAGFVSDGGGNEAPLMVRKAGSGDLDLTWSASCSNTDDDYAVYEGTLGDFASHRSNLCTTGGATSATITPGAGGRYFLVVPTNGTHEGSYGYDSSGQERPQADGGESCYDQLTGACN
jgi:hypothetical protein